MTFDVNAITDIQVIHSETPTIGGLALDMLTEEALAHQTSGLDVVSGATLSSAGFRSALADAIKQAGGDSSAMEKYSRPAQDFDTEADVIVIGAGGALYGYKFKVGVHYFMGGVQGTTRVDGTGIGDSLTFGYVAGHSVITDN